MFSRANKLHLTPILIKKPLASRGRHQLQMFDTRIIICASLVLPGELLRGTRLVRTLRVRHAAA
eukprot:2597145-Pleurochrysis_carterae.AAC.1